jgi:DNA-binding NarL/FixJ family response regulator
MGLYKCETIMQLDLKLLSKRQQEVLQAACGGQPDKIIAEQLGVSPRTLEGHWRAIHRKLGSVNRCQAGFIYAFLRDNTVTENLRYAPAIG